MAFRISDSGFRIPALLFSISDSTFRNLQSAIRNGPVVCPEPPQQPARARGTRGSTMTISLSTTPRVGRKVSNHFSGDSFLASLREASRLSIFPRQDAKGAKVFKRAGLRFTECFTSLEQSRSRRWRDYPVKIAPFTTPFILHPICESLYLGRRFGIFLPLDIHRRSATDFCLSASRTIACVLANRAGTAPATG